MAQLRLRVIIPVAVLGLIGLGVGALVFTGAPAAADPAAVEANLAKRQTAKKPAPAPQTTAKKEKAKPPTPLERQLRDHKSVVVLFYGPGDAYDTIQTHEARAGAIAAGAGFLAVDVSRERELVALATEYEIRSAPAILVFARGPRVVVRIDGYADRETVAQAAQNARA